MSSSDRFSESNINSSLLHSQIIYNNGYATGINETKKIVINKIKDAMNRSALMVDSETYKQLSYLLTEIEKI